MRRSRVAAGWSSSGASTRRRSAASSRGSRCTRIASRCSSAKTGSSSSTPARCSSAAVCAINELAGRASSPTGWPTTARAPRNACARRVRRPGPAGSGTMAPTWLRRRIGRQALSSRDRNVCPIGLSGSMRITAAWLGSTQPARIAATRTAARSDRPDSSRSTSSSRQRSRSAPACDCSHTYPRADAADSWSTKANTASANAASPAGSTAYSRAARDTCRQATRPPTWYAASRVDRSLPSRHCTRPMPSNSAMCGGAS
jgi:hypothetical protein